MDSTLYIALENWESENDAVCDLMETINGLTSKDYTATVLLEALVHVVERRHTCQMKLQTLGFQNVAQIHLAYFKERERLNQPETKTGYKKSRG